MAHQTPKHFVYSFHLSIDFHPSGCARIAEPFCNLALCIDFAQGTLSHMEIINKFFFGLPTCSLGDVTCNADYGPSNLARKTVNLTGRERLGYLINVAYQVESHFPDV